MTPFLQKSFILLLLLFLLIPFNSKAQWSAKNNSLTGDFNDIAGYQESHLILATDSGLYSTSNGAAISPTWSNVTLTNTTENTYFQNVEFLQFELYNVTSNTNVLYSSLGFNSITNEYSVYLIDSFNPRNAQRIWTSQPNQMINALASNNSRNEQIVILGNNGFALQYKSGIFYSLDNRIQGNLKSGFLSNVLLILDDENNRVYRLKERFGFDEYQYDFVKFLPPGNYNCVTVNSYDVFVLGDTVTYFDNSGSGDISTMDKHFDNLSIKTLINSDEILAATDTGIYYTPNIYFYLERQVSTLNQNITNGSVIGQTDIHYAVGPNQTILRSDNINDDQLELYGRIEPYGACTTSNGSGARMVKGSANSRSWFVNGVQIFSNDVSYTYDGSTSYLLELQLGGRNGGQATFSYTQTPSAVPDISMNITSDQSSYCLRDQATITIENSEPDVMYKLQLRDGFDLFDYGDVVGDGNDVSINFYPTRPTGNYFIKARNINSLCTSDQSPDITIGVLRTEADFSYNIINPYPHEMINFYNHSTFSDTYLWGFGSNASNSNSTLENPVISYATSNNADINLTATNNIGCTSTIQLPSPNIVNEPQPAASWNLESGISTGSNNVAGLNDLLRNMHDTGDGIIIYGRHDAIELKSRAGRSITVPEGFTDQVYIAKYDYLGTLKFMIYGTSQFGDVMITDLKTDSSGNILLSTWGNSTLDFFDAKQDIYTLNNGNGGHIVKLTANGEFIEAIQLKGASINQFHLDSQNDIYLLGGGSQTLEVFDWSTNTLIDTYNVSSLSSSRKAIYLKLDTNYQIVHANTWLFNDTNGYDFNLKIDSNGVLLFYGSFINELDIVSDSGSLIPIGDRFSWTHPIETYSNVGYVIKMNSSASSVIWKRCFVSINNDSSTNTNWLSSDAMVEDITFDFSNNVYVAIRNGRRGSGNFLMYDIETMNGNQLLNSTDLGVLVYKKLDSNGNELWNTGTEQMDDAVDFNNIHLAFENNKLVSTYIIDSQDDVTLNPQTRYYSPTVNDLTFFTNYPEDLLVREFRDSNGEMQFIRPIGRNTQTSNGLPALVLNKVVTPVNNVQNGLFVGLEMRNPWGTAQFNNETIGPNETRIMLSKVEESSLSSVFPDNTAGITSINENRISFRPNPATDSIKILYEDENALEIVFYSLFGQVVKTTTTLPNNNIDISEMKNGIYLIKVIDKEQREFISKLIIE
jgi:hypothetical protein